MSVSDSSTEFKRGDLVAFRAHKIDAIVFTVKGTELFFTIQGGGPCALYLKAGNGMYFLASECRHI